MIGRALIEAWLLRRVSVRDIFDFAFFIIAGGPDLIVVAHGEWLRCCELDCWIKTSGRLGCCLIDMDT